MALMMEHQCGKFSTLVKTEPRIMNIYLGNLQKPIQIANKRTYRQTDVVRMTVLHEMTAARLTYTIHVDSINL